ncbi:Basic 7s globulin [Thalictrum thalictroides]|uniref:Basic 7s globulin n=1 Tax=Thalictrum thalictroides TaxID=46969 RepID=A0A7J6VEQ3_THATH|nr:Basic 7s globulin [Thalictrum thalictroides]
MASKLKFLLFSAILFFSTSFITNAQPSFRPRALVLSITKDPSVLQYLAIVSQRTPLASINTVVDLGGQSLWVDCQQFYVSSSYAPARCGSAQCSLARSQSCGTCNAPAAPGCNNNTCGLFPENTVTNTATSGELAQDVLALPSTNGRNPGPVVSIPRLLFTCAPSSLLDGLASGVRGMAGLGRAPIGLPSQFAAAFSFNRKFAICLPSTTAATGVIFFGNTPYIMQPNIDISASLMYTPLLINPVSTAAVSSQGERSTEYFIEVKSIKVNAKAISLNTSLLSIRSNGFGGTKISTVNPYTVLETSIYKAVTEAFVREANYLTRVASVAPLEFCYDSRNVGSTRVGPAVPSIDLVLQSESVFWRISGANSMVQIRENVLCLGFVDGGSEPRTSIVIGGHQLEDNLLQFDLSTSRLGFSSSLLGTQTTCSNFNFTSNV